MSSRPRRTTAQKQSVSASAPTTTKSKKSSKGSKGKSKGKKREREPESRNPEKNKRARTKVQNGKEEKAAEAKAEVAVMDEEDDDEVNETREQKLAKIANTKWAPLAADLESESGTYSTCNHVLSLRPGKENSKSVPHFPHKNDDGSWCHGVLFCNEDMSIVEVDGKKVAEAEYIGYIRFIELLNEYNDAKLIKEMRPKNIETIQQFLKEFQERILKRVGGLKCTRIHELSDDWVDRIGSFALKALEERSHRLPRTPEEDEEELRELKRACRAKEKWIKENHDEKGACTHDDGIPTERCPNLWDWLEQNHDARGKCTHAKRDQPICSLWNERNYYTMSAATPSHPEYETVAATPEHDEGGGSSPSYSPNHPPNSPNHSAEAEAQETPYYSPTSPCYDPTVQYTPSA